MLQFILFTPWNLTPCRWWLPQACKATLHGPLLCHCFCCLPLWHVVLGSVTLQPSGSVVMRSCSYDHRKCKPEHTCRGPTFEPGNRLRNSSDPPFSWEAEVRLPPCPERRGPGKAVPWLLNFFWPGGSCVVQGIPGDPRALCHDLSAANQKSDDYWVSKLSNAVQYIHSTTKRIWHPESDVYSVLNVALMQASHLLQVEIGDAICFSSGLGIGADHSEMLGISLCNSLYICIYTFIYGYYTCTTNGSVWKQGTPKIRGLFWSCSPLTSTNIATQAENGVHSLL